MPNLVRCNTAEFAEFSIRFIVRELEIEKSQSQLVERSLIALP